MSLPSIMSGLTGAESPPASESYTTPAPVEMRAFGDSDALRKAIYGNVLAAARSVKPESNTSHSLELTNVDWGDPDHVSIADHKKAILEGRSLTRKLKGTWVFKDAAGTPLASRTTTIAHVPHLTHHGTFVINGSEYTLGNQLRLQPGIFARVKDNGEIESHVAVMPGKGVTHRYYLEPNTGIFKVHVGQSNMAMLPLLRAMGATDDEIRGAWGRDLLAANNLKDDPKVIDKLYLKLGGHKADPNAPFAEKSKVVAQAFDDMRLDPEVMTRVLGKPRTNLNKDTLLAASQKLLQISRGEADTDDRDHLAYQQFMGPEDLMAERIGKDRSVLREMLWKATFNARKRDPANALSSAGPGAFTGPVQASILSSGIGQSLEEVNSADVFDQQTRVSKLGYGGIGSIDSIPAESRAVQPSHLNFIDLLRTPECYDANTEVMTYDGWKLWPHILPNDRLACLVAGRLEFHRPDKLIAQDYDGSMYGAKSDFVEYLVTPEHRMWVQPGDYKCRHSEWRIETAEEMYGSKRRVLCGQYLPSSGHSEFHQPAADFRKVNRLPLEIFEANEIDRWKFFLSLIPERGNGRLWLRSRHASFILDVERLAFSLGASARASRDQEGSVLYVHIDQSRLFYRNDYRVVHYAGRVYCASVPGGLLYVRRNKCIGFWCGNSFKAGVDSRVGYAVQKGSDRRIYSPFLDVKTGQTVNRSPQDVADLVVAFPGELERVAKYSDADKPLVAAMVNGKVRKMPRSAVDLAIPHMEQAFSPINNLVPLKSALKGQRAAMASRFITQALPLKNAEAPFVRAAVPGTNGQRSFEEHYGKNMGAVFARDVSGRVVEVTPDRVAVKYADGNTQIHELYNNFPYNRKTFIHSSASVQPGDPVSPGQLLAKSNYTDDKGAAALGMNVRTAYIPFRGLNYEDAVVISESLAKKLSSEHMYQHQAEWDDKMRRGKKAFASIFPATYGRNILEQIDDDGVVKPGTVVKSGDPLVLIAQERELSHKQVHSAHKGSFADRSLTWDHHGEGIVTDAVKTPKGVVVAVKAYSLTQQGDKLCYDPDTKVLTVSGWKPVAYVTENDEVFTLNPNTGFGEWQQPTHVWAYQHDGLMYKLITKHLDMLVTPEHRLWVSRPDGEYAAVSAREFYASKGEWKFKKDCKWKGETVDTFEFGELSRSYAKRTPTLQSVSMSLWLGFLGYYIAEGWVCDRGYVKIGQFRSSSHWEKIDKCLTALGLPYRYNESDGRFEIGNVWFAEYLAPLGDSYSKRVPAYVQALPPEQIEIFFSAYMASDGHKGACWEYSTSSELLAYDMQLICIKLGWCVSVKEATRTDNWAKERHWRGRVNRKHLRPWWKKSRAKQYAAVEEAMVPYSGMVYCITVPNHIIYVERGDKTYWSLNSGRYG